MSNKIIAAFASEQGDNLEIVETADGGVCVMIARHDGTNNAGLIIPRRDFIASIASPLSTWPEADRDAIADQEAMDRAWTEANGAG